MAERQKKRSKDAPSLPRKGEQDGFSLLLNKNVFKGEKKKDTLEPLREKCRKGNPFPLIAAQWPSLLITDIAEAEFFEGEIGDEENPCLRLDDWQREILVKFFDESIFEIAQKGATKVGKGFSTSLGINLWFDVYDDAKVILCSQRYDHAEKVIFGEIAKWRRMMKSPSNGILRKKGITDNEKHYITIANPESGEGFSGQHGSHTIFVFDEASAIPDGRYDDACKQAVKIIALANPRTLFGWFRSLYSPCEDINKTQVVDGPHGKRLCMTIDGADVMNVRHKRLDRPVSPPCGITIDGKEFEHNKLITGKYREKVNLLIPAQCDYQRHMAIRQHPDPRHVAIFAHGHFPEEDPEKQVIMGSWLRRHEEAYAEHHKSIVVEAFSFDAARSLDGDKSTLCAGGWHGCKRIHAWQYNDTMFHVSEILKRAENDHGVDLTLGRNPICIDMDGLGAGVGDRLREQGVWVIEFRGNAASAVDTRIYANLRAEGYGTLARRLDPDDQWGGDPWMMPVDQELREELTAPEKIYSSDAIRWRLMPKTRYPGMPESVQTVKDKIGRSPDKADGVVYLFHAVREFHALNEYFAAYERPLTVWPDPSLKIKDEKHPFQKDKKEGGDDEEQLFWSLSAEEKSQVQKIQSAFQGNNHIPWWMSESEAVNLQESREDNRRWQDGVFYDD